MNRIDLKFSKLKERGEKALIPFITSGDPDLDTTFGAPCRGPCVLGALPLPRSLTRCARSFGCGERYQLTQRR